MQIINVPDIFTRSVPKAASGKIDNNFNRLQYNYFILIHVLRPKSVLLILSECTCIIPKYTLEPVLPLYNGTFSQEATR